MQIKNKVIKVIFIVTICLILIDQLSKFVVKCKYQEPIGNDFINITLVQNSGMAFSLNSGNTKNIVLSIIILLIVMNFIRVQKDLIDLKTAVALGFILAGGISNLIDRVIQGGVIDFIRINHFSIFNLADCYVVIGWILIVIFLIKFNKGIIGGKDCEKQ